MCRLILRYCDVFSYNAQKYYSKSSNQLFHSVVRIEEKDVEIYYYVHDKSNGYMQENRTYYVSFLDIIKKLSHLYVKQIIKRRSTLMFSDLYK